MSDDGNPWRSVPKVPRGDQASFGRRDATPPPATPDQPAARQTGTPAGDGPDGRIVFDRRSGGLVPMAIKGYLLTLVTLGIYRFWFITNVRRFFWSRTDVHKSPLEFTGRGSEIFIGFLIALAIVIPLQALVIFLTVSTGPYGFFVGYVAAPVYFVLIMFAFYRSRRYRVNRTVWRGLRFHQSGNGWGYAFRAAGWGLANVFTFGLLVPVSESDLYRYRIERMHLGNVPFDYRGTWRLIAVPYYVLWAIFALPLLVSILAFVVSGVTWQEFSGAWVPNEVEGLQFRSELLSNEGRTAAGIVTAAFGWAVISIFAYPYYHVKKTNAFFTATGLNGVHGQCMIPVGSYYGVFLIYFLVLILAMAIIFPVVGGIAYGLFWAIGASTSQVLGGFMAVLGTIVWVGAFFTVLGVINLVFLQQRFWALTTASITILNPLLLDEVAGRIADTESGFGAGFADAMDVGDFEIGL